MTLKSGQLIKQFKLTEPQAECLVTFKRRDLQTFKAFRSSLTQRQSLVVNQFRTAKDEKELFKLQGQFNALVAIIEDLEKWQEE